VGGIGIMNIMLADVLERTKEIGIRRAVGATERDILFQFLSEAVIISMIGGVLGIITGFILTSIITGYAAWRMVITPISVVIAFVVSVCVGISFGIFPAKKAAEKDPAETIRYE
jgi:putative ABC transport system permease protein